MNSARKYAIPIFGVVLVLAVVFLIRWQMDGKYRKAADKLFPGYEQMTDVTGDFNDAYVKVHFPALKKAYEISGAGGQHGYLVIADPIGYGGEVSLAVGIDAKKHKTAGVIVLSYQETAEYAGKMSEKWFCDRFAGKSLDSYLKLAALDASAANEVIQLTGATVSSQAMVNGVNTAIGAYAYLVDKAKLPAVQLAVDKPGNEADSDSFIIKSDQHEAIRVTSKELADMKADKVDTILQKTTGTKEKMLAEGPTLKTLLAEHDINLDDYQGVGMVGSDGYYALLSKEILLNSKVILAIRSDGKPLPDDEKPVRVVIPGVMGPYWVKKLAKIELYTDVPEKDIVSVKVFDALTQGIEPYLYEYYGKKDKAIEIGKIFAKLGNVDPKGFFTMTSSDGLVKNETIAMVSQRYYLKITGDNAPMNVAPNFKLGTNVKHIACFSTTKDAVIFPSEMKKMTGERTVNDVTGMPLYSILLKAGVVDMEKHSWKISAANGSSVTVPGADLKNCIMVCRGEKLDAWPGGGKSPAVNDVLEATRVD